MNSSETKHTVHREGALVSLVKPMELPVEVEMDCILFTCLNCRQCHFGPLSPGFVLPQISEKLQA